VAASLAPDHPTQFDSTGDSFFNSSLRVGAFFALRSDLTHTQKRRGKALNLATFRRSILCAVSLRGALLFEVSLLLPSSAVAYPSLGLQQTIITEKPVAGAFPVVQNQDAAPVLVSPDDYPGVRRAAADLQADVKRVSGIRPELIEEGKAAARFEVIVGTIGKSPVIDRLVKSGQLDVRSIAGKWESFIIATVAAPIPGVDQALVIAGSDKRGTIYGVYEISEQIGVSPWYWWADVPPQHHAELFILPGVYVQGPPAVKYRGIFINDEDPSLSGWSKEKFGGVNSKMYTHMFELLLRLRANYLWPAMWGKTFNEDDPENPRLADEYGIVMGTSHHEPMMRAQEEWTRHGSTYGNGEWNYVTNGEGLRKFWTDGVARNKDYENIYTVGMRGDGDMAMPDAGGMEANKKLLEQIITDQRQILAKHINPDPSQLPQIWALFTEVQKYYDAGLQLPDDVTLLFTDDNVGNLRRVPTPEESARGGGAGIYYHMDMNGGPYSYKWLNSNPLPKIWEQMNLAYRYGANRVWIVNVGDLKPLEVPIEFFLRMAWAPEATPKEKIAGYQQRWAEREFGKEHAVEIADIVAKYAKYNEFPKPELVKPNTFSLLNYREAEQVAEAWTKLVERAEHLASELPANEQDAYYELVLHPVKACSNAVLMNIASGRNQLFAQQGRASTNAEAELTRKLFAEDKRLTDFYNHTLAGGKWDHMMDQVHLGYVDWYSPQVNVMPPVSQVDLPETSAFGVSVEGTAAAWPAPVRLALPPFDSMNRQRSYIEVFPIGTLPIHFDLSADKEWIKLTEGEAFSAGKDDRRIWVDIDWDKAPAGKSAGMITVAGPKGAAQVEVSIARASAEESAAAQGSFAIVAAPISIDAQDAALNVAVGGVSWERIPDYGPSVSAMSIFPVTVSSVQQPISAPHLDYSVYFANAGYYNIDLVTNPTLDLYPGRALSVAVSIDDQTPQVVSVFTPATAKDETFLGRSYYENARNNSRIMHFSQNVLTPGKHILRITMVDPTVVIERIILHRKSLAQSFFGPPTAVPVSYNLSR
jgi:hypothetical protein